MISHFKQSVKQREPDIILCLIIVLIALISFGIGQLTAPQSDNQPIIIEQPTSSIQQSLSEQVNQPNKEETGQGIFVGSINSNKYHWPDCPWAGKIADHNQIWFSSEAEAQSAGYAPCGNLEKYAP